MLYKLEKDGFVACTDKEYKKNQLLALGFKLITEPKKPGKKQTGEQ